MDSVEPMPPRRVLAELGGYMLPATAASLQAWGIVDHAAGLAVAVVCATGGGALARLGVGSAAKWRGGR